MADYSTPQGEGNTSSPERRRVTEEGEDALPKRKRPHPLGIAALFIILVLFFGNRLATLYTDGLWFASVAQKRVFVAEYGTRLLLFGIFGAASFLIAAINLSLADRFSPPSGMPTPGRHDLFVPGDGRPIGRAMQLLLASRRLLNGLLLLGALVFAIAAGLSAQLQWDTFLLFTHPIPFGERDPQFGRDISFYVFTLPFLNFVQGWLLVVLFLVAAGVAVVYLYQQGINAASHRTVVLPHVRAHLSALAALLLMVKAWGYWLDQYGLLYGNGLVPGAGYTDIHIRLPMLRIMIGVVLLAALAAAINIRRRTLALPFGALSMWLIFSLGGVLIPGAVQRIQVKPNESVREAPFLARAIAATRRAYDVDSVRVESFPAEEGLTSADLERNRATVANIRLWDYEPLLETYPQQQGLRQYYTFPDVDVDRYQFGPGDYRQVMVAAREIAPERLDSAAQTWPNLHLRYTHGYGMVMSPAGEVAAGGLPTYLLKDVPLISSNSGLNISQPRVYYGMSRGIGDYTVAPTLQRECDYPAEEGEQENSYDGTGGIRLTLLNRLMFAARYANWSLLLSQDITPESRLIMEPFVPWRVKKVAPFLTLDRDPYPIVANGRILWVQDAYTVSDAYPYSQPSEIGDNLSPAQHINYVRNSVKAVVDAYDGTVTLYASDEHDPVLRSWRRIFPGLFQPASMMPDEVRAHRRYPEDLLDIQRQILASYHVTNPGVFYSRADAWDIARSSNGVEGDSAGVIAPYYALLKLPGESGEEFVMLSPFTPHSRENMIGLLTARCDGDHYGERILYRFPSSRIVYGPAQIGKRIRTDSKISPYLSLVDQKGSQVKFGFLRILPVEKSLLYIQPLYLRTQSSGGGSGGESIPELKQVIVAYENRIVMQPTLAAALEELFGVSSPASSTGTTTNAEPAATGLVETALRQYEQGQAALRAGDFAEYGKENRALGETLHRLRAAQKKPNMSPKVEVEGRGAKP